MSKPVYSNDPQVQADVEELLRDHAAYVRALADNNDEKAMELLERGMRIAIRDPDAVVIAANPDPLGD